ncbi:MAG: MBL fold metallo-hydrolase [Planctomycetota bacterium]
MPRIAGLRVEGLSIGGIETCIDLPELKVAFDIGRCPPEVVPRDTILFTHAHMDHMGGIVYHAATRGLRNMRPPTYVVPAVNAEAIGELFDAWSKLDRTRHRHRLVPLSPGEEHALPGGLVARPFHSPHSAPCQGYGLWRRKERLRKVFRGKSQEEIRRLRVEQGLDVTEVHEWPEVAFCGDTKIDVVEREEVVRTARVLILEVTFLDSRVSVADARAKGHVHLEEVAERADLFRNEALLLTHFSSRYRADEIVRLIDQGLPDGLRERVTPLLAGHRR